MKEWSTGKQIIISASIAFVFTLLVAAATLKANAIIGAAVYSFPLVLVSMAIVYSVSGETEVLGKLLINSAITLVACQVFLVIWGFFILRFWSKESKKKAIWGGFGIGFLVWLILSAIFVAVVMTSPTAMEKLT